MLTRIAWELLRWMAVATVLGCVWIALLLAYAFQD